MNSHLRSCRLALLGLTLGFFARSARAGELPNVVILFADDAGYADFGFQPNCVEEMKQLTPHIDTIARDGVRFSNAYMSGSVCSPSRAGLMTGRYQQRFGFDNNLPPGTESGLSLEETFGVARLRELGYATGLVGKWHLGYPEAYQPNERGFDWFYGLLQGARSYFPMPNVSAHQVIQENGVPTAEGGYVTDRLGDAACRFIERHEREPFFLFVSFTAPHGPNQPKPGFARLTADISPKLRADHVGLLLSLDENVGKILACLFAAGLDDDTIVIFTNDNGGQTQTGAKNTPLRGRKGMMFEGGIRVPWLVRWPGMIDAGSVIDDPVSALDILPTVFAAAGARVDPEWQLDGRSLLGLMKGEVESLPTRPLFWRMVGSGGDRAMREGNWKLVDRREVAIAPMLFDLGEDISETANVAASHPELLAGMLEKLDAWESKLIEPYWGPGAPSEGDAPEGAEDER